MKTAWEAGFARGFSGKWEEDAELFAAIEGEIPNVDFWSFDKRPEVISEKKGARAPKTSSPKKPMGDPEELGRREYDSSLCRARKYNKGHPLQCWKSPVDGEDICQACMGRRDDDSMDFWGYYNEPLEDCCLNKDGKPHSWKALAAARAEKKNSDREEKAVAKVQKKKEKDEEKAQKKKAKDEAKDQSEKDKASSGKKKRLKKLKKKAEVKDPEPAGDLNLQEEEGAANEVHVDSAEDLEGPTDTPESPKGPQEEEEGSEDLEEDTQSLGDSEQEEEGEEDLEEDTQSLGGPEQEVTFEEYTHDGYTMKWNKITNQLLDPDDDELLGMMVFDDDGNPRAEINVDESDSDDSDEE